MCDETAWLDALEAKIEAEDAEDAARPESAPRPTIRTYEGFSGTGMTARDED